MSTKNVIDRSCGSDMFAPRGRGMTKAKEALVSYLLNVDERGARLPAGRSANGVSLKAVARDAGISVRSAQRMSPLIGRWALSLGTADSDLRGLA